MSSVGTSPDGPAVSLSTLTVVESASSIERVGSSDLTFVYKFLRNALYLSLDPRAL